MLQETTELRPLSLPSPRVIFQSRESFSIMALTQRRLRRVDAQRSVLPQQEATMQLCGFCSNAEPIQTRIKTKTGPHPSCLLQREAMWRLWVYCSITGSVWNKRHRPAGPRSCLLFGETNQTLFAG